jgi:hypothetical protein
VLNILHSLPKMQGNPMSLLAKFRQAVRRSSATMATHSEAGETGGRAYSRLRHTFAYVAASSGESLPMIGKLLAGYHKQRAAIQLEQIELEGWASESSHIREARWARKFETLNKFIEALCERKLRALRLPYQYLEAWEWLAPDMPRIPLPFSCAI